MSDKPVAHIIINLQGPRIVTCAGCGNEIVDERHAVSIDECGEPTAHETGACRATCKAFHDIIYGLGIDLRSCPSFQHK